MYQLPAVVLDALRTYGTDRWEGALQHLLATVGSLQERYANERTLQRIPVVVAPGERVSLSAGSHSALVKSILDAFCACYTPGAQVVYVGDTQEKWAYFDQDLLKTLGVTVEEHGKMPDVVVYDGTKRWLVLIEAVTSHGPVGPKRHAELKDLFAGAKVGLVFVTAFPDRRTLNRYLGDIAWETEVWVAESPTHLIHFNGERFLGPYPE